MTPNPKRLYETERKRQQRARLAEGRVHKVSVYLTLEEWRKAVNYGVNADPADGLRFGLDMLKPQI
jgi:hypothetical protein